MARTSSWIDLLGRVFLAFIFVLSGAMKIANWTMMLDLMAVRGLPWVHVLLAISTIIEIGCGIGILLGFLTRLSAVILFLYLIPVTFVFHAFWSAPVPAMAAQLSNFLKNLAIMGGMLFVAAHGAGRFSLDALMFRRSTPQSPSQRRLEAA